MGGRASKQKGNRREREIVDELNNIPGVGAMRVPLSGACEGYKGDIEVFINALGRKLVVEVKARESAQGWKTIKEWLGANDLLVLKEDRQPPLVVLPWSVFRVILTRLDGLSPVFTSEVWPIFASQAWE